MARKSASKSEVVTWIKNIGMVETRTRFAVTTSCPMDLRLFPMDRQMCSLIIQGSCPSSNMILKATLASQIVRDRCETSQPQTPCTLAIRLLVCIFGASPNLNLFASLLTGLLDLFVQSSAHPNDELTYKWRHGINDSRLQFLQGLEYQDSMTTEIRLLGYRYRVEETTF